MKLIDFFRVLVVVSIYLSFTGCNELNADLKSKKDHESAYLFGYGPNNHWTSCRAPNEDIACPVNADPHEMNCVSAGYRAISCEGCGYLCSGKITDSKAKPDSCDYYGNRYSLGESFETADGCNTCVCDESTGSLSCAERACSERSFDGTFVSGTYDSDEDVVYLDLYYSACERKDFDEKLLVEKCGKSNPPFCAGKLFYKEDIDDCEEVHRHTLRLDLQRFQIRPATVRFTTESGALSVFIDRKG